MAPPRARWIVPLALPLLFLLARDRVTGTAPPEGPANLLLDISREFLDSALGQAIDRCEPVDDVILKTRFRGTGRTIARLSVELVPQDQFAIVDVVTTGTTFTETVGVKGPVQLSSDSTIPFQIRQRVYIRPDGITADGVWSRAWSQSNLTGLTTDFRGLVDCLAKKVASKQFRKDRELADSIASRHAEDKLNASTLAEATPKFQETDQAFKKNLAELAAQGIKLAGLGVSSSQDALSVRARLARPGQAVITAPPALVERPYLAVRVHETTIEGIAGTTLAGRTFAGKQLEDEAKKLGLAQPSTQSAETDWSITFVKERPVMAAFAEQTLRVTLRIAEFTSGDNDYDGMDMTVKYKLQTEGGKIKAVRQGPIEAFPPGFKQGQRLSGRQQVMRTVLQKRFSKILPEEVPLPDVELPEELRQAGPLAATRATAAQGWLLLTWRKGPAK